MCLEGGHNVFKIPSAEAKILLKNFLKKELPATQLKMDKGEWASNQFPRKNAAKSSFP